MPAWCRHLNFGAISCRNPSSDPEILIIGGTGVFGSQLVTRILATTGFDVIVAGRDERRCKAFIARQNASARAQLSVAIMDTGTVTARELVMTGAFVVIDAAGPYQGQKLCLPRAAIEAKVHYLGFANGRDFVGGIAMLDAAARSTGVTILAGVSSTPGSLCARGPTSSSFPRASTSGGRRFFRPVYKSFEESVAGIAAHSADRRLGPDDQDP